MSHITHAGVSVKTQLRSHWIVALSALLALLATTAVVLVLAIDGGSSGTSTFGPQQSVRADGGPDESAIAATVGSQPAPAARPDESAVAASINRTQVGPAQLQERPDESAVASSINRTQVGPAQLEERPDESTVASSISGR